MSSIFKIYKHKIESYEKIHYLKSQEQIKYQIFEVSQRMKKRWKNEQKNGLKQK